MKTEIEKLEELIMSIKSELVCIELFEDVDVTKMFVKNSLVAIKDIETIIERLK